MIEIVKLVDTKHRKEKIMGKYDDIINLPHHISKKHPQMSMYSRAAQFAPFAALTGYEDSVKETARLTNERIEIDDEVKAILDAKLQEIQEDISNKPTVTITYFVPDTRKDGGKYVTVTGNIKKIDRYKQVLVLEDQNEIPINDVIEILTCSDL